MGEAVGRRLWFSAGNWSSAVDLCQHRQVGRFLEGVDLDLVNNEVNVNGGTFEVDDDQVTGFEILEVGKNLRPSERIIDVPGNCGRAYVARDAAASIPKCRMPDRVANRTFWRIHHIFRCKSDSKHRGVDIECRDLKFKRHSHRPSL